MAFGKWRKMMTRMQLELVREGKYAAEVSVELIEDEGGWSPSVAGGPPQPYKNVNG
jgi:hypothetical protein